MQRDILIFQNPVIVKGHNIFSLITPKATHVNKARERVKEISEFRQPHDGFKGEAACGARAPAPGAGGSLPAPCLCRPPGTRALRPEPPVHLGHPHRAQEGDRASYTQTDTAQAQLGGGTAQPDLLRGHRGCPTFISG